MGYPVNFEILHSVFRYAHMNMIGKKRVHKIKNPAHSLQGAGFQCDNFAIYLSVRNYFRLKVFIS